MRKSSVINDYVLVSFVAIYDIIKMSRYFSSVPIAWLGINQSMNKQLHFTQLIVQIIAIFVQYLNYMSTC